MIRRPPRSTRTDTLFPTRRSSDLSIARHPAEASFSRPILAPRIYLIPNTWPSWPRRSKRLTATPRQENDSDRITRRASQSAHHQARPVQGRAGVPPADPTLTLRPRRSEEQTSELPSLMRITTSVLGLTKKN